GAALSGLRAGASEDADGQNPEGRAPGGGPHAHDLGPRGGRHQGRALEMDGETRMTDLPVVFRKDVQPEWVDYNQHMGDFAYGIVFSNAGDLFLEIAGLTPEYRDRSHCTIYTLENHTRFLK